MNSEKIGNLIKNLRIEKCMTQAQLAEKINVTDRAVSKWERGEGCPDITLIHTLASVLGINEKTLLSGSLEENEKDTGNIKRIKFFTCPTCGNIITGTGNAVVSCCGRTLCAEKIKSSNNEHNINIQPSDDEFYITFNHPMTKEHYISFIAYLTSDSMFIKRMYPEQSGETNFPRMRGGRFIFGCSKDGIFEQKE